MRLLITSSAPPVPLECASISSSIFVIVSLTPNITFAQFSTLMNQFVSLLDCTSQMTEGGMLISIKTPDGTSQIDCTTIIPINASELNECLRYEMNDTDKMQKFYQAAIGANPTDIHVRMVYT